MSSDAKVIGYKKATKMLCALLDNFAIFGVENSINTAQQLTKLLADQLSRAMYHETQQLAPQLQIIYDDTRYQKHEIKAAQFSEMKAMVFPEQLRERINQGAQLDTILVGGQNMVYWRKSVQTRTGTSEKLCFAAVPEMKDLLGTSIYRLDIGYEKLKVILNTNRTQLGAEEAMDTAESQGEPSTGVKRPKKTTTNTGLSIENAYFYIFDDKSIWEIIKPLLGTEQQLERNATLPGLALLLAAHEQTMGAVDSSGTTVKIRSDGTQGKKSKGQTAKQSKLEGSVVLNTETVITAHLLGHSLPGRLARAITADLGLGNVIRELLCSSIRLSIIGTNASRKTQQLETLITQRSIDHCLAHLRKKLHPNQADLANIIGSPNVVKNQRIAYAAYLLSSLDAIPPLVNKPVLLHPAICIANKTTILGPNWGKDATVYHLSLLKNLNTAVPFFDVPGFLNAAGLTQGIAMAMINNLYGPLDLIEGVFGMVGAQRSSIAGPLKEKISGLTLQIDLQKTAEPIILVNYSKGGGAQHQQTLHTPIANSSKHHQSYLRDGGEFSHIPASGFISGHLALHNTLSDTASLKEAVNLMETYNAGTSSTLNWDQTKGYFNTVSAQTEEERKRVVGKYMLLLEHKVANPPSGSIFP